MLNITEDKDLMNTYYNISDFLSKNAPEEVTATVQQNFVEGRPSDTWQISLTIGGEHWLSMELDIDGQFIFREKISPNDRLILKQIFTEAAWGDFVESYNEFYAS